MTVQARCYFCDAELTTNSHAFKVGLREEHICEECYVKMINRRKAVNADTSQSG